MSRCVLFRSFLFSLVLTAFWEFITLCQTKQFSPKPDTVLLAHSDTIILPILLIQKLSFPSRLFSSL